MCYVKATYPKEKYEQAFLELWVATWVDHLNIGDPKDLASVLGRHFPAEEVKAILQASADPKWKAQLSSNTEDALAKGAYGAPWMWVRNSKGEEEPFFGSDRFHYMWDYLDIPHHDFEVLGRDAKL
jgi:glutathione S-transferase kappa 1